MAGNQLLPVVNRNLPRPQRGGKDEMVKRVVLRDGVRWSKDVKGMSGEFERFPISTPLLKCKKHVSR